MIPSKFVVSRSISNPTSSAIALIRSISKPTYSPSSLNSNGTKDVSVTTVYVSFNSPSPSDPFSSSSVPHAAKPLNIIHENTIAMIRSISKPTYSPSSLNSNGTKDVSVTTVYVSFNSPSPSDPFASSSVPHAAKALNIINENKIAIGCFQFLQFISTVSPFL